MTGTERDLEHLHLTAEQVAAFLGAEGRCALCGGALRVSDAIERRDFPDLDGSGVIHTACGEDGVRRWIREGKPERDPLTASRKLRWSWGGQPNDRGGHDSAAFFHEGDGSGRRYYRE